MAKKRLRRSWRSLMLSCQQIRLPQQCWESQVTLLKTDHSRMASMGLPYPLMRRRGMRHSARAKFLTQHRTHALMTSPNWCVQLPSFLECYVFPCLFKDVSSQIQLFSHETPHACLQCSL